MLQAEVCLGVVREIFGIKTASAHIILVEYILHDRVRWTMVVSRIILIEFDGDNNASADVRASPFSTAGVKLQTDVEVLFLHISSCWDASVNADLICLHWYCESALTVEISRHRMGKTPLPKVYTDGQEPLKTGALGGRLH